MQVVVGQENMRATPQTPAQQLHGHFLDILNLLCTFCQALLILAYPHQVASASFETVLQEHARITSKMLSANVASNATYTVPHDVSNTLRVVATEGIPEC